MKNGPEGQPRESSVGWRWALPESRLSPGQCRKSPDICPAALQPKDKRGKERQRPFNCRTVKAQPGLCPVQPCVCVRYFVIEEADPEDVLHAGRSVSHAKVPQGVPHQDDVGVFFQLLEVFRVPQGPVVLVVHVDHIAFEAPDDALRKDESGAQSTQACRTPGVMRTYVVIKVHEVGDDLDVRVVDASLADDFLQHVAQPSREDEDRHAVLLQAVEELLVAVPEGSIGLPHHLCQLVLLQALLHQQLVRVIVPAELRASALQPRRLTAEREGPYHSTMKGYFSSMVRLGSISMG